MYPRQLEITKEGEVIEYKSTWQKFKGTADEQADLNDLRTAWVDLPQKNHDFVQGLIAQYDQKGSLSEKQWYWVAKLAGDLPDRKVPNFTLGLKDDLAELEDLRAGKALLAIT